MGSTPTTRSPLERAELISLSHQTKPSDGESENGRNLHDRKSRPVIYGYAESDRLCCEIKTLVRSSQDLLNINHSPLTIMILVAQWSAHLRAKEEVVGSNPTEDACRTRIPSRATTQCESERRPLGSFISCTLWVRLPFSQLERRVEIGRLGDCDGDVFGH